MSARSDAIRKSNESGHTEDPGSSLAMKLEHGVSPAAAIEHFDALPPVTIDHLLGRWRGSGVPTGHPFDGLLENYGWHGKRFESSEIVHPLVFKDHDGGLFSLNPSVVPLNRLLRYPAVLNRPAISGIGRRLMPLARTSQPKARLRMTEFRGVLTATMIYDGLPINDIFRRVDEQTLLGVMDTRLSATLFFFLLRREA